MTTDPVSELPVQDREVLTAALKSLKDSGVPPLIPLDVDLDGDGIVDAWGLDDEGNLIVVKGQPIAETSYEADGEGP
jgi:hypothetical protein